ncbi:MAG TPA: SDR family NAD(P)-dependent oxidoreductase, partial [Panacibacter sp.]|nr:SDR family NAD(P)-dependent oxidoreductase [Panacibacter sp.]
MKNKISYQTEEAILITQHISIPQQDVDLMYTLITGSGSGIGKALAEECAKLSMNILLVALPGDDLAETENSIRANYKVQCHSLAIDLSQPCTLQKVHEWVKQNNYRVNILINNVGVGSKGAFEKLSPDFYITQLNLNVTATCLLTRLFVDELKANAPSHILNVGSMGGFFMLPEKAVYTASKAFIYSFSRTL